MNGKEFYVKLLADIIARADQDEMLFGNSFIEVTYNKSGFLDSLKFKDPIEEIKKRENNERSDV